MKTIKSAKPGIALIAMVLFGTIGTTTFAPVVTASERVTTRIIGGDEAEENAWPSLVALVRTNNQSLFLRQFCAANLLTPNWVVTAAHCLYDSFGLRLSTSSIRVAVGFTDLATDDNVTEIDVTNIITHPDYQVGNPSAQHDLALLRLAHPAEQPVMQMYQGNINENVGESAVVAGWGSVDFSNPNQPLFPTRLNEVSVPVVSPEICNSPASYNGLLGEGQVCAGLPQGGKDSCVGDSGGPLMVQQDGVYRQIGLVSYGRGCAEPGFYGVYTRLAFYETWINEFIAGDSATTTEKENEAEPVPETEQANGPLMPTATSGSGGSSGGGSLDGFLPFVMMLFAIYAFRRNLLEQSRQKHQQVVCSIKSEGQSGGTQR